MSVSAASSPRPAKSKVSCLPDCMMTLVFNQVMVTAPSTAVHVLPLVCRRWHQLLRTTVTFQTTASNDRPTLHLTCSVATVVSRFKTVQSLRVSDFLRITPHCYTVIATRCPNIARLWLDESQSIYLDESQQERTKIVDVELKAIASGCNGLTHIDLNRCKRITDAGFAAVGRLEHLTHLDLSRTRITDASLRAIAAGCRNLNTFVLNSCKRITDAGFTAAIDCFELLTHLEIGNVGDS